MAKVPGGGKATVKAWEVVWCPSNLLDKDPPADAQTEYDKAKAHNGWKDSFMKMNLEADEVASTAPKQASGLHEVLAAQERALETAQGITAEINIAVAKRLLSARLPQIDTDMRNPTLTDLWRSRQWMKGSARAANGQGARRPAEQHGQVRPDLPGGPSAKRRRGENGAAARRT